MENILFDYFEFHFRFVAQHMKNKDRFEAIEEDWKYVAMVRDLNYSFHQVFHDGTYTIFIGL